MLKVNVPATFLKDFNYELFYYNGRMNTAPTSMVPLFRDENVGWYLINIRTRFLTPLHEKPTVEEAAILAMAIEFQMHEQFLYVYIPADRDFNLQTDVFDYRIRKAFDPRDLLWGIQYSGNIPGYYIVDQGPKDRPIFKNVAAETFDALILEYAVSRGFFSDYIYEYNPLMEVAGLKTVLVEGLGYVILDAQTGKVYAQVFGEGKQVERTARLVGEAPLLANMVINLLVGIDTKNKKMYDESVSELRRLLAALD